VDPVERAAEVHGVRAERVGRIAALHMPRHIRLRAIISGGGDQSGFSFSR